MQYTVHFIQSQEKKKSLVIVIDNLPFLYRVWQSVQIKSFNFVFISESGGTFNAESVNFSSLCFKEIMHEF